MKSSLSLSIVFAVIFAASAIKYAVKAPPQIRISSGVKLGPELGVIYGTRQCGGAGKLIQWTMETCNTTDSPCEFLIDDNIRQSEVEFIPSATIETLGFRVMYNVEGTGFLQAYETILEDNSVIAGEKHIFRTEGQLYDVLKGRTITAQFILFRADNEEIEVCAEADFILV